MSLLKHSPIARGIQAVRAEGASDPGVKALIETLNKAFADFKAEHTAQLEDIKKGNADALQALKVENINADIDRLQKAVDEANTKLAAAQMGGGPGGSKLADAEYSDAFRAHFSKGAVSASLNS